MAYRQRIIDEALDELFPSLAAIALEGAKAVGKTETAKQRAVTVLDLTDPGQRAGVEANPELVAQVEPPVLIDEWQLEPPVWDRVRRAVDDDPTGGRFLLTGSAGVAPGTRIHSGAGRIVSLKMRPLALSERGLEAPVVSLPELLTGSRPEISGESSLEVADYADEILRSGFPGVRDLPQGPREVQLDGYLARIVERELPENGIDVRRPAALRYWLAAYASATATAASYTKILDLATPGEAEKPTRQTVAIYRDHLERIFVLDPLEAWAPLFSPINRLTRAPRHHLVDPALAARSVGIGLDGLLQGGGPAADGGGTWLGRLFESLATQSVRVYADAARCRTFHLRTADGRHEVDLIVERSDGACLAFEVKLGGHVDDSDVKHLNWLGEELGERLIDRAVLYTGRFAYRRRDGVAVIPLALLGP